MSDRFAHLRDSFPAQEDQYANATIEELATLAEDISKIELGPSISGEWPASEPLETSLPAVPAFDLGLLPISLRTLVVERAFFYRH